MLREVFRTVPIQYWTHADKPFHGFRYYTHPVYVETLASVTGLTVGTTPAKDGALEGDATPGSPTSIYVFTQMSSEWSTGGQGYYRFDGKNGKLIRRIEINPITGGYYFATTGGISASRSGASWSLGLTGVLLKIQMGQTALRLVGEETEVDEPWINSGEGDVSAEGFGTTVGYSAGRFAPYNAHGDKLGGWGSGGCFAIDDVDDAYLDISFGVLRVYYWKSKEFRYYLRLPTNAYAITLEDKSRCYILLNNGTVILFDYLQGEVLGAGSLPSGGKYHSSTYIRMGWDPIFRRLLILELTPNNPDGSCSVCVKGYRFAEFADRVTIPIPLKVPRQGRQIPVLAKIVTDRNVGVSAFAVAARVSGDGSLVGMPITTYSGDAIIEVDCHAGVSSYDAYDYEAPVIGGSITVDAQVTVLIPKAPPSQGLPRPGGGAGAGPIVPGPPAPPGTGGLPAAQAPNMVGVLERVYDAGAPNGRPWDLSDANKLNADGQGMFVEVAVAAMHDQDAGFGHLHKNPGVTNYNGHAVDATVYKRTDGILESIDFITGDPNPTLHGDHITWQYNWHYTDTSLWYYPA